jgi:3-isopropylmalate dehydrogenase
MKQEAEEIERAVENVIEKGYRTEDIAQAGKKTVGTKEMGEIISNELHTW